MYVHHSYAVSIFLLGFPFKQFNMYVYMYVRVFHNSEYGFLIHDDVFFIDRYTYV